MDTPREPPVARLDGLLLDPTRFTVVAVLAAALDVELGFLREAAELDDTTLSSSCGSSATGGWSRAGAGGEAPAGAPGWP
jgi:hypothetical protein